MNLHWLLEYIRQEASESFLVVGLLRFAEDLKDKIRYQSTTKGTILKNSMLSTLIMFNAYIFY